MTATPAIDAAAVMAARIGIADADMCGCKEPRANPRNLPRLSRFILWIFGDTAPNALANPKLEAVRRFFCATRAGYAPGVVVMAELQRLGLDPEHLAVIANLAV